MKRGRLILAFNGEIYNHDELRMELQAGGAILEGNSDSEILLRAYERWGEDCLHRFNGMFAFVIVDLENRTLFLARDRFGVKPLYWWRSPEGFLAIASEIKQFTVLPGWNPRVNVALAYDYLVWSLADHEDQTLFEGVRQLRGGEACRLSLAQPLENPSPKTWYSPGRNDWQGTLEEASDRFMQLLTDSIRLRLRADVPVGTGLSGGLDSSSVVCIVQEILKECGVTHRQSTFSACSHDPRFDERFYADIVVEATGVEPHYIYPDAANLADVLPRLTWHQDEPFASTSIFAQWCIYELVRSSHVTVTLDGYGADELLCGYPEFCGPRLLGLLRRGAFKQLLSDSIGMGARLGRGFPVQVLLYHLLPDSVRQSTLSCLGRPHGRPSWICVDAINPPVSPLARYGLDYSDVSHMSSVLFRISSFPAQLHWCDRNSMAHSVESRAPFLDFRLVEFLQSLPEDFLLFNGQTKRILRRSMRAVLPESIRTRKDKMGFVTPEELWVREHATDWFLDNIDATVSRSSGLIRPSIRKFARDVIAGNRPFDSTLWRIVSFGSWLNRFSVTV